jgi:hypothetical protein
MKAERKHDYWIDGYGTILFVKVAPSFKVLWRRVGLQSVTLLGWLQEGQKPSAELAVFYCKVACAMEDGLDKYHYHDKGLIPQERTIQQLAA